MNTCPCCASRLLRHIRGHEIYWFCQHCRQAMPVLSEKKISQAPFEDRLSRMIQNPEKVSAAIRKFELYKTFTEADFN